ncbi:MAG: insulinase family protein [Acidobacteria bacterium]|jgi:predicted Zn-dependent peptidase|nr:insulinase family protein [Acidobacteriota bacterium]
MKHRLLPKLALASALALVLASPPPVGADVGGEAFTVPVEYHKLDNGLKVVLSRDTTAPTAVVAVYYNIGLRIEPRDRTGFAHLFEHMMFQGSKNLAKMEFVRLIQSNGGVLNGSTRFDFTNYFEIVPSHTLEMMLWGESDRMRALDITQDNLANQQGVVINEVKVNVLNRPYGGFPWLDMPQYANTNWYNAHNFYGDLEDLEAATLEDVKAFFEAYYTPSNAVVVVTGDFDPEQTLAWIETYFGSIPSRARPEPPDISEPRQAEEKRASKTDTLATRPALAVGYHVPSRSTPEYFAMGLLDQILVQGRDSRLHQALVQRNGFTGEVSGGINLLGNMFNVDGPVLWTTSLMHDAETPTNDILKAFDEEIERLRSGPVDEATLELAKVKARSSFYDHVEDFFGFGRADLLACFALFDDEPGRINRIEAEFEKVTPELLLATAQEYLRPSNRTVLTIVPQADEASAPKGPAEGSEES